MSNTFQNVATYNDSMLALLQNSYVSFEIANMKFKDFDKMAKNLGDTVEFDIPPRMTTKNSLKASFQSTEQRVQSLTVDKEISSSYEFSAQEFIFNAREYMDKYGNSAVAEIGSKIEKDNLELARTSTYRHFGDGKTDLSSFLQLGQLKAFHENLGMPKTDCKAVLSDLTYPKIINSGLNQFTPKRNDKMSMSWELGNWNKCDWFQSNLLTQHDAGTEGNEGSTLTVVSVTKNAEGGVTAIEFSGASSASDADSVKKHDKFTFSDGVSGQKNLRFLTNFGHEVSQSAVQFRATADAASDGSSNVTVSISPALQAASGINQNINTEIVAGMQATVLPDHRCGLMMSGKPMYLAMPVLPEVVPFPTGRSVDKASGASLRTYYGNKFGENEYGMVHDSIWGNTLVADYATMVALPV